MRIICLSFLIILCSCSKSPEEEVLEAIDIAQTHLSNNECDKAIDLLEDVGRQNDNPIYLQVLASAYACRAEFDELNFIDIDIPNVDTSSGGLFKSLSILSDSYEASVNNLHYTDLHTAIDVILKADGGAQPSQVARNNTYGDRKAGDMGLQVLYMSFVQLGKYLNFYGNVDATGVKGGGAANVDEQGAQPSSCFITYTYAPALAYLLDASKPGGACDDPGGADNGHPDLSLAAANLVATKVRMCEGLVLITNMLDVLNNVTLTGNSSLAALASTKTVINSFKTAALTVDPTLATLLDTTSQTVCETLVATPAEFDRLQTIFAALFETGLK